MANENIEKMVENQETSELFQDNSLTIKSKINEAKVRIENKISSKTKLLNNSKIDYESPAKNVMKFISSWQYNVGKASNEAVSKINNQMNSAMNNFDMQEEEFIAAEENEFKRSIATKVMNIRVKQEKSILENKNNLLDKEKISIIGKVLGKQREKNERILETEEKIKALSNFEEKIKSYGLDPNIAYNINDILAEIEIARNIKDISKEDKEQLEYYKMIICSKYKIVQEKVKTIVTQRTALLENSCRSEKFLEYNSDKVLNKKEQVETEFEKIIRNISLDLKSVELLELEKYGISRDTESRR